MLVLLSGQSVSPASGGAFVCDPLSLRRTAKTWMAGTSPAMTRSVDHFQRNALQHLGTKTIPKDLTVHCNMPRRLVARVRWSGEQRLDRSRPPKKYHLRCYPHRMDLVKHLARALVEVHGNGAVNYAERAAVKVRAIGLPEKAEIWALVIAAIKAMPPG